MTAIEHKAPPPMNRVRVVLTGDPVPRPLVETPTGWAEWAAASLEALQLPQCQWCGLVDHFATVRLYPRPDAHRTDAIDELKQVCPCCATGPGGLLERLRSEQTPGDDFDIQIELLQNGRWIRLYDFNEVD